MEYQNTELIEAAENAAIAAMSLYLVGKLSPDVISEIEAKAKTRLGITLK